MPISKIPSSSVSRPVDSSRSITTEAGKTSIVTNVVGSHSVTMLSKQVGTTKIIHGNLSFILSHDCGMNVSLQRFSERKIAFSLLTADNLSINSFE